MKRGSAFLLVTGTIAALLGGVGSAMSQTCFTAGGENPAGGPPPPMTWSVIFILSADETQINYTINCCGCAPGNTWVLVAVASEGFATNLAGVAGKTCPFSGVWKNTDPVPLTPALVTALKNGTMALRVYKPLCTPASISLFLVEEPCDE